MDNSHVFIVEAIGGEWEDHWNAVVGVAYSIEGAESIVEDFIERLDPTRQDWGVIACSSVVVKKMHFMETYEADQNQKLPEIVRRFNI